MNKELTQKYGVKVNNNGKVNLSLAIHPKYYLPLMEKCKEVDAIAKSGKTSGKPSVGALVRLIATGEVALTRR
jgi:hypothetical protein